MATQKSIRINQDEQESFLALYGTIYNGASHAASSFLYIRRATLLELSGKFTQDELLFIIRALEKSVNRPETMSSRDILIAEIQNAETFNKITRLLKGCDFDTVVKKIEQLTSAQVYYLRDEIDRLRQKGAKMEQIVQSFL